MQDLRRKDKEPEFGLRGSRLRSMGVFDSITLITQARFRDNKTTVIFCNLHPYGHRWLFMVAGVLFWATPLE